MTARQAMRHLIARTGYTVVPGAYDTLTARLVEQAGFAAVYLTGGGYSRANGYPDLGLLTLNENARFIGLTVEAVQIPVIADADTGYRNAINLIRTVRRYEKSGGAHPRKCFRGRQDAEAAGERTRSHGFPAGDLSVADPSRRDPRRPARVAGAKGRRPHHPRRTRSRDLPGTRGCGRYRPLARTRRE